MTPSNVRRAENLALIFQEVLTAIERLRGNRQGVTDANAFRHHTREALRNAANQVLAAGYPSEDVKFATFASVAFLDESVLNSQNPVFTDWLRKPLQEELFGTHVAGETFFQNLQQLLARGDSQDLADLLEVHYLCMLLGFGGRYSAGNRGELTQVMQMTAEKIRRIRGPFGLLSPNWMPPPGEGVKAGRDPLVRKLAIAAAVCAGLMIILFVVYKLMLGAGVTEMGAEGQQTGAGGRGLGAGEWIGPAGRASLTAAVSRTPPGNNRPEGQQTGAGGRAVYSPFLRIGAGEWIGPAGPASLTAADSRTPPGNNRPEGPHLPPAPSLRHPAPSCWHSAPSPRLPAAV